MSGAPASFSAAGPLGQQWLPVAASTDLQDRVAAVRLLGRDLVVWRDPDGVVLAAPDQCTHTRGELSKGELSEGLLSCPKHGWTFGAAGRCVFKPSGLPIAEKAHLKTFACAEQHGLVWVSLGVPRAPIIDVAPEADGRFRRVHAGASVWRSNAAAIVDALLVQETSLYGALSAELPFVVHGARTSDDGHEHVRLVLVAPGDARTSRVTTLVWTSCPSSADDPSVVDDAIADLDAVREALEAGASPAAPDVGGAASTGATDWRRDLDAFLRQGAA